MLAFAKSLAVCVLVLIICEERSLADHSQWLGQNVILKSSTPLRFGQKVVDDGQHVRLYTAERVDGDNLLLKHEETVGWVDASAVVLESEGTDFFNAGIKLDPTNTELLLRRAFLYMHHGDANRALADLNTYLSLRPKNVQAALLRARLHCECSNFGMAWADLEKAIDIACKKTVDWASQPYPLLPPIIFAILLDPNDADLYRFRGFVFANRTQFERALAEFDKAIQLDPQNAENHFYRGYALFNIAKPEDAIESITKAIQLNSQQPTFYLLRSNCYRRLENFDKALIDATEAIRLEPKNNENHLELATVLQRLDKYEEAIAAYNDCLRLQPDTTSALKYRGYAYRDIGKYDEAIADWMQANRLVPDLSLHRHCGMLWQQKGKFKKAIAEYSIYLLSNPDDARILSLRGQCYGITEQFSEAFADLNKAIRISPTSDDYINRSNVWITAGKYDKALADLDEAIRLDPENHYAFASRGQLLTFLRKTENALADLTEAIRLDPRFSDALILRGNLLESKNELDKAIADYSAAITVEPQNPQYLGYRFRVWNKKRNWDEALSDVNAAILLNPKNIDFQIARGNVLSKMKNYPDALEAFNQVLRVSHNHPNALMGRMRVYFRQKETKHICFNVGSGIEFNPDKSQWFKYAYTLNIKLGEQRAYFAFYTHLSDETEPTPFSENRTSHDGSVVNCEFKFSGNDLVDHLITSFYPNLLPPE
ncbi:MAG: tetratricopeptide repeat protein [Planctomycetaceae bacterium]